MQTFFAVSVVANRLKLATLIVLLHVVFALRRCLVDVFVLLLTILLLKRTAFAVHLLHQSKP
jgi:hypothetical protein